jgi:hypothetical protein
MFGCNVGEEVSLVCDSVAVGWSVGREVGRVGLKVGRAEATVLRTTGFLVGVLGEPIKNVGTLVGFLVGPILAVGALVGFLDGPIIAVGALVCFFVGALVVFCVMLMLIRSTETCFQHQRQNNQSHFQNYAPMKQTN